MGEKGKKIVTHDEGTFHPSEIPLRTWQQYEDDQWERESLRSIGSMLTSARANKRGAPRGGNAGGVGQSDMAASMYTASLYGFPAAATTKAQHAHSQPASPVPSGFASPGVEPSANAYTTVPVRSPKYGEFHTAAMSSEAASGQIGNWSDIGSDLSPRPSHARVIGQQQPSTEAAYTSTANVQARTSVLHRPRFSAHSMSQIALPTAGSVAGHADAQSGFHMTSSDQAVEETYGVHRRESVMVNEAEEAGRRMPTDQELAEDIRSVVSSGNMHTITLQSIRKHLEAKHGAEAVKAKRGFINDTVDEILTDF
jgi:chitin synthase